MENSVVGDVGSGKAILIDVRTDTEWMQGHAKGAIHFELSRIQKGEFPAIPKDKLVLLYCRSGSRSGIAAKIFVSHGFTNVTNLGGLSNWQKMGGEIEG